MKDELIKYRGKLKFIRKKYVLLFDLIDDYIKRIDENTAKDKDATYAELEKETNKDLLQEVENLIKELGDNK